MTPKELMAEAGLTDRFEAWAFGEAPDRLAGLVLSGTKCATCSAFDVYQATGEPVPRAGDLSVILDSRGEAVCVIRTTRVSVIAFDEVSEDHAFKEGEGDRTLSSWRDVHRDFLTRELAGIGRTFDGDALVVCEEFELVHPKGA